MNIGLAIALIGLTSLALALLLLPLLLRHARQPSRNAYNLAVYRDQLAEVERDLGRGLLNPEQVETARAEIGRRILTLGPGEQAPRGGSRSLAVATVAILLLPIAAIVLYSRLGSPALPDQPFAARGAAATTAAAANGHVDIADALTKLRDHLRQHPDDLTGWLLLARSDVGTGRYPEAVDAYRRAVDLSGHRADIVGDWGEAQVLAAGGTVTAAAREAFAAALSDPETAPRSRYYLGLAQLQQGDTKGALTAWRALEADSPADAKWLPLLRQRITEAAAAQGIESATPKAPGTGGPPSGAAVAAAAGATPEERQAMIGAMVARLAARLEQQPNDVDGWARLGRSYMVLAKPEKARQAFARAVALKPDDAALRQALAEAETAAKGGATRAPTDAAK